MARSSPAARPRRAATAVLSVTVLGVGHRANLVLLDEAGWSIYYSHWAARDLHLDLARGPAHAIRFVRAQDRASGWIGRTWAEGGALIDTGRRRLLFFAGGDLCELGYRRAYFEFTARTWPGWTLQWAYGGLGDIAAALGVDRAVLDLPEAVTEPEPPLLSQDGTRDWWALLSVSDAVGRVSAVCLDAGAGRHWALWVGPGVLARLPAPWPTPEPAGATPDWGLHLDLGRQQLGWWTARSDPLLHRVASRWPGWQVEFWEDGYEQHLAACEGQVTAPPVDLEQGRRLLRDQLSAPRTDSVAGLPDLIARQRAEGHDVEILAPITSHTFVEPDVPDLPDAR